MIELIRYQELSRLPLSGGGGGGGIVEIIIIIIIVILLIVIITSIGYLGLTMRFGFELLLWVCL